jgi:hypothetical protein
MARKHKPLVKVSQMTNQDNTTTITVVDEAPQITTIPDIDVPENNEVPQENHSARGMNPVVAYMDESPYQPVVEAAPVSNLDQVRVLVKQTGNAALVNYMEELLEYADKMAPDKTMNTENGAMNQSGLYATIVNMLEHTGQDFRIAFSALLCVFHEYRNGAFGGAYINRFMESVSLNASKRKAHIKMINLLAMTANPVTRKDALKHIDLKREVISPFTEETRMRIDSYFKG